MTGRKDVIMNEVYCLGDVEEALSEMEELVDIEDRVIEQDEEHLISATGYCVAVPSLGLNLHEGMFYVASESARGGMRIRSGKRTSRLRQCMTSPMTKCFTGNRTALLLPWQTICMARAS